jgi:hypothetical protein
MKASVASDHIRRWATLAEILRARKQRQSVDWEAVNRVVTDAKAALAVRAVELKDLLRLSKQLLEPFDDPLTHDLGLHRWLAQEREEAYSDWLQWVLVQLRYPDLVYSLFNRPPPLGWEHWREDRPNIKREVTVPQGHEGQRGRLDLLIEYSNRAILVVEVKTTSADTADTLKQKGYSRWVDNHSVVRNTVLLATHASEELYEGFTFCSWADLCVNLRRTIATRKGNWPHLVTAMMIAFIAAVEQNLVQLAGPATRRILAGEAVMFDAQIVDHLARSTAGIAHGEYASDLKEMK